jgi:hypothetical protein
MARIIIQTNSGREIKTLTIYQNNFRRSNHAVLSLAGVLSEFLKGVDEAFDTEEKEDTKPDGNI